MTKMPRLTKKLILLFLAFGVVPLVAVTAVTLGAAEVIKKSAGHKLIEAAHAIGDKIDRNLYERYGDAQAFGFNDVWLKKEDWYKRKEEDNALIRAFNRYMTSYSGIYIFSVMVDTEGKVVACNTRDDAGKPLDSAWVFDKNFSDDEWFKAVMKGQFTTKQPHTSEGNDISTGTFVEDIHVDPDVERMYPGFEGGMMAFAAALKDRDGKVVGALINHARFNLVEEIVVSTHEELVAAGSPTAEISVLDGDGRVVLDYDPSVYGRQAVRRNDGVVTQKNLAAAGLKAAQRAVAGESGEELMPHFRSGEEYLAGFTPLTGAMGFPGMNWSVQVRMPTKDAYAAIGAIRWQLGVAAAACLAAILVAGYLIGKKFAAPVVEMTHAAAGIAQGDVDQKIEHRGKDEVGDLADALRGTVEYIRGAASAATSIGNGDLSLQLTPRSSADGLSTSLLAARDSLQKLTGEARRLIDGARNGRLDVKGSTDGLKGGYRDIVDGMNRLVAAVAAPIGEAKSALRRVAEKDLTARMTGKYAGDYAAIKEALNGALENLVGSLTSVSAAADQVATAASEITQGNQQTAQSTSEQAGSLEEVTSSLQEITAMSKRSAANAQQARGLAEGARETAEQGSVSVTRMSSAIGKIKTSADETAKIVKTIDEIAFQTNLLALNAAVEAARAGDAGKGFAVVAEEVRALAMRSAEAAKSVAELIAASVKNAEEGVSLNQDVTKGFDAIAGKVRGVVEVMSEIAAAAEQQSDGVAQVNGNIETLSKATQQNAATTEETASAAEELSGQAQELRRLVEQFRLAGGPPSYAPRAATYADATDDAESLEPAGSGAGRDF